MKIGSLCTGYGGLDIAAEAFFNAETIWCAEYDQYASKVIQERFGYLNYKDIKVNLINKSWSCSKCHAVNGLTKP